jgi:urease accessory protein
MSDDETYLLLLLSDSNLPTGSFVASSGLESYVKHGFASSQSDSTINFIRDSLGTYARSALPFVSDTHLVVRRLCGDNGNAEVTLEGVLTDITLLDELYDTMCLNHVAKRASRSQGVALLTLYTKGFSRPALSSPLVEQARVAHLNTLAEKLKSMIRSENSHGHLPICWGVLTASLGLSLGMLPPPRVSSP